jgi:hypothetical protein
MEENVFSFLAVHPVSIIFSFLDPSEYLALAQSCSWWKMYIKNFLKEHSICDRRDLLGIMFHSVQKLPFSPRLFVENTNSLCKMVFSQAWRCLLLYCKLNGIAPSEIVVFNACEWIENGHGLMQIIRLHITEEGHGYVCTVCSKAAKFHFGDPPTHQYCSKCAFDIIARHASTIPFFTNIRPVSPLGVIDLISRRAKHPQKVSVFRTVLTELFPTLFLASSYANMTQGINNNDNHEKNNNDNHEKNNNDNHEKNIENVLHIAMKNSDWALLYLLLEKCTAKLISLLGAEPLCVILFKFGNLQEHVDNFHHNSILRHHFLSLTPVKYYGLLQATMGNRDKLTRSLFLQLLQTTTRGQNQFSWETIFLQQECSIVEQCLLTGASENLYEVIHLFPELNDAWKRLSGNIHAQVLETMCRTLFLKFHLRECKTFFTTFFSFAASSPSTMFVSLGEWCMEQSSELLQSLKTDENGVAWMDFLTNTIFPLQTLRMQKDLTRIYCSKLAFFCSNDKFVKTCAKFVFQSNSSSASSHATVN